MKPWQGPTTSTDRVRLRDRRESSVLTAREYLNPARYFKFYLCREVESNLTIWLPEGFSS